MGNTVNAIHIGHEKQYLHGQTRPYLGMLNTEQWVHAGRERHAHVADVGDLILVVQEDLQ